MVKLAKVIVTLLRFMGDARGQTFMPAGHRLSILRREK